MNTQCKQCDKVVIQPTKMRRPQAYCSNACKQAAHRKRKGVTPKMGIQKCPPSPKMVKARVSYKERQLKNGRVPHIHPSHILFEKGKCCVYCGRKKNLTVEHLDAEGAHTLSNLTTACWLCNKAKSNMKLKDFKRWIGEVHLRFNE